MHNIDKILERQMWNASSVWRERMRWKEEEEKQITYSNSKYCINFKIHHLWTNGQLFIYVMLRA